MTDLPEILAYTEGDDPSPRFISGLAFEALLVEHRAAVLAQLGILPTRPAGPARPMWVEVTLPDGTRAVGSMLGHDAAPGAAGDDPAPGGAGGAF